MYLRSPSPTISCASCALVALDRAGVRLRSRWGRREEEEDGATTIQTTSSNAASFLYKFNVEPRNPDGTKIGNERHDDDVEGASNRRRAVSKVQTSGVAVLHHAAAKRRRRADGVLRMRKVQTHLFAK